MEPQCKWILIGLIKLTKLYDFESDEFVAKFKQLDPKRASLLPYL